MANRTNMFSAINLDDVSWRSTTDQSQHHDHRRAGRLSTSRRHFAGTSSRRPVRHGHHAPDGTYIYGQSAETLDAHTTFAASVAVKLAGATGAGRDDIALGSPAARGYIGSPTSRSPGGGGTGATAFANSTPWPASSPAS